MRDAALGHGDAKQPVHPRHGDGVVGDDHVAGFREPRHFVEQITEPVDIVVITHNPITMARMNRLFGVTMAERGVSQLVSVDLEEAIELREAS